MVVHGEAYAKRPVYGRAQSSQKKGRTIDKQRNRIFNHAMQANRSVMDEYELILKKKSSLNSADRAYLISEVEASIKREHDLEVNRNRKINQIRKNAENKNKR